MSQVQASRLEFTEAYVCIRVYRQVHAVSLFFIRVTHLSLAMAMLHTNLACLWLTS